MQQTLPARTLTPARTLAAAPALPVHGGARLARGWAGALLATGLAAGSHTVLGAAHAPHPLVLLLAVALAAPVCTVLAGRRLCLPRVVAAVLASQAILHGLYGLASPAPGVPAALPTTAGHLGHAVPASGELASFAAAHTSAHAMTHAGAAGHDHLGLGMLTAHLLAAVLTVLLIRHGERLLVRAAGLVVDAVLARRLPALRPASGRVRLSWGASAPRTPAGRVLIGATGLRGPPALSRP